ncbi:TAXI family TRAP transporter solute-binding subunit [Methylobacterium sp. JK268]
MMRRHIPIAVAALLALLAAGLLAYQWMGQATTLRVAVGPAGSENARMIAALAQSLARGHEDVRLRIVPTGGVAESAAVAERGKADLAVVRSDVGIPATTQTVAILHRDAALLITTEGGPADVAGLKDRRVGVVRQQTGNAKLLDAILQHHDLAPGSITPVLLDRAEEVGPALREGRIDVAFLVAPLVGPTTNAAVTGMVRAGLRPAFIPVGDAAAMARRSSAFESVEVGRGTFGGTPPRPADAFTTLGVTHRLVAQATLADATVSELARLLFVTRPAVVGEVPLANQIEAPDTAKGQMLPLHPGAEAYYDGEVESFFERYGDWFYLIVMALSILGSVGATLVSRAADRSRARDMELLRELLAIVRAARDVEDEEALAALEHEADEILAAALARAGTGAIDNAGVAAFTLGLDQARRAIAERRAVLRSAPAPDAAGWAAE